MDKSFFEETLRYNWDLPIGVDRSLFPEKVSQYLSKISPEDQKFILDLLKATTYVDFPQFKSALFESFQRFRQAIGNEPFYLILPTGKIGSEHWIVALLWPELRKLNLVDIITEHTKLPLEGVTNILIVDDAVYSGNNTLAKIDNFLYQYGNEPTVPYPKHRNDVGQHFKFHILIPYVSTSGTEAILNFCGELDTECTIYGVYYLPALSTLIRVPDQKELSRKFDIEPMDMPAVYFDHKVAGPMSTYSTIYLQGQYKGESFGPLLKTLPSREKILQLENLYSMK